MLRIAITTSSFDDQNLPDGLLKGVEILRNTTGRRLTEDEVAALLKEDVVGLIAGVEPLTGRTLRDASSLKVISRVGTGTDSIDLDTAEELDIEVRRTPDAPTDSVAELTVALTLSVLRHIPLHDRSIRDGGWTGKSGRLLRGRQVGLLGAGRIGQAVARLLDAFGANVSFHDPLVSSVPGGQPLLPLESLLANSEILSMHLPLTAETRHILGEPEFSMMPAGSIIVNVARGGLIDERALHSALLAGHLAGAALDCFEDEPYMGPLRALDNVVLSPHVGSGARETRQLMEREAAQNLLDVLVARRLL